MAIKIRLRRVPISKDRHSIYFDYCPPFRDPKTMKMIKSKSIGLYLYQNPKNEMERQYNKEVLLKAEIIRGKQITSFINKEYNLYDKDKMNSDFLHYFYYIANKKGLGWMTAYYHFEKFVEGKCTFSNISIKFCEDYRNYLLNSYQIKHPSFKIKRNSASEYYLIFKSLLRMAYKEKILREDISSYLETISKESTKKEILVPEELVKLIKTPCEIPVIKAASLFSCMTGLRLGDILELTWDDIVKSSDGGYCIKIKTEKNKTEATLPISNETLELCGERGSGKVFKGFKRSMSHHPLRKWIKQAGISKKISFHCFRHTFATLQLAMGTDIYTVSKMLTHKNISTTQIYLSIVDSKKREAASKISLKSPDQ